MRTTPTLSFKDRFGQREMHTRVRVFIGFMHHEVAGENSASVKLEFLVRRAPTQTLGWTEDPILGAQVQWRDRAG